GRKLAIVSDKPQDAGAGGLGLVGDDGQLAAHQAVQQGGLAHIGPAHDGGEPAAELTAGCGAADCGAAKCRAAGHGTTGRTAAHWRGSTSVPGGTTRIHVGPGTSVRGLPSASVNTVGDGRSTLRHRASRMVPADTTSAWPLPTMSTSRRPSVSPRMTRVPANWMITFRTWSGSPLPPSTCGSSPT